MVDASIRRARRTDRERLEALWAQLLEEQSELDPRFEVAEDAHERWANDFPLWLEDGTRRIYVAEPEGVVVGFVNAHRWGPPPIYKDASEVYVDELYVAPEARRRGWGRQLVDAVRGWADELQADRLRIGMLVANEEGAAFWKAQHARPFYQTLTIELDRSGDDARDAHERRSIGF